MFTLGLIVGLFVGSLVGMFCFALITASKENNSDKREMQNKEI